MTKAAKMIVEGNVGLRLDSKRVSADLKTSIINLCKSGLPFTSQLCIEGVIGITVDKKQIVLLSINEVVTLQDENCQSVAMRDATSPDIRFKQETTAAAADNSVMDLCVKPSSVTSQETLSSSSSRTCPEQDTQQHQTYSISSLDANIDAADTNQKLSVSSSDGDAVKAEVSRSCGSRRRARKSKTTRHISKQSIVDVGAQSASDDEMPAAYEDSRSSQGMHTPEVNTAEDEPVNLSANNRCAQQRLNDVMTNNVHGSRVGCGGELFGGAPAGNNLHAMAAMNLLNNMHGDATLQSLNPLMALSEHHQHQQAHWLNSLAAHLLPAVQPQQPPLSTQLPLPHTDVTQSKNSNISRNNALDSLAKVNNANNLLQGPLKVEP